MTDKEPSFRDFLSALIDTVASNKLTDALRRKFQAQSFFEFFNRLWATGVLLFVVGFIGVAGVLVVEDSSLSISPLDLGNVLIIVGIALFAWLLMSVVNYVNAGKTVIDSDDPKVWSEVMKICSGILILAPLTYQFVLKGNPPVEAVLMSLLAAVLTGVWLLGIAWLLGGLSGLARIYRPTNTDTSTETEVDSEGTVD